MYVSCRPLTSKMWLMFIHVSTHVFVYFFYFHVYLYIDQHVNHITDCVSQSIFLFS